MSDLTSVYDIAKSVGRSFPVRHRGLFGVEIETETTRKYDYPKMKFWECKKDNSLRDFGVEYVLKAPVNAPELQDALREFETAKKQFSFRENSVSTSVHCHMNIMNSKYLNIASFMTAWCVVEGLLVRFSGPDRLSNLFCMPCSDAEGIVDQWKKYLTNINRGHFQKAQLSNEQVKYSALNCATLTTIGTLEVRTFRGETDTAVIQRWTEILQKLYDFAHREDMTPVKVLQLYEEHRHRIVNLIFGEYARDLQCKDWEKLITNDHIKLASELAFVSKDWSKFGIRKVKPVYKEMIKADLEDIAMEITGSSFDTIPFHERNMVYETYHRRNPVTRIVDLLEDI